VPARYDTWAAGAVAAAAVAFATESGRTDVHYKRSFTDEKIVLSVASHYYNIDDKHVMTT